jgi:hypothetical protein
MSGCTPGKEVLIVLRIVSLLLTIFIAGCSLLTSEAPPQDVDKAAALFFQRLDKNDFDGIYNDLSQRFKKNKSRQTVTDSLKELAAFGKVVSYERASMRFQGEGKDRMAIPIYMTTFEQAAGDLTLTFQDEGGEWKLLAFEFKRRR